MGRGTKPWCAAGLAGLWVLLSGCDSSQLDEPLAERGQGSKNHGVSSGGRGGNAGDDEDDAPGAKGGSTGSSGRDGGTASRQSGNAGDDAPDGSGGDDAPGGSGASGGNTAPQTDASEPFVVPPFSKPNLLESIGGCALARYRELAANAARLDAAASALAEDPADGARRDAARQAWKTAMTSLERAEPFRFGPAARAPALGAENLRDEIYAFPLSNHCSIDQQLVDRRYDDAFASILITARGMGGLEYLLFREGDENACAAGAEINGSGAWAALDDGELAQRRADYAAAVAHDVRVRAGALVAAWDPAGENFLADLSRPGRGGSVYADAQSAFNGISDGLFMLDKEVKDWKLGWPLGLVPDCLNAPRTCPDAVESRFARTSQANLQQNLSGFRDAFEGCGPDHAGLGFDDWLREAGAGDLADRLVDGLADAERAVTELEPQLEDAIATNPARVLAVHAAIKRVTDLLKTEFVTVLDLELPTAVEGDND